MIESVVVPINTLPLSFTVNNVVDALFTRLRILVVAEVSGPQISSVATGWVLVAPISASRFVTPPEPLAMPEMVNTGVVPMLNICACCTPAAAPESTGMSEKLTMPASVSNTRLPSERLLMVVVPLCASTLKIPLGVPIVDAPIEKKPVLESVANVVVVADVDDAMVSKLRLVWPFCATSEKRPHGEVVPMPTLPPKKLVPIALNAPLIVDEPVIVRLVPVAIVKSNAARCEVDEANNPLIAYKGVEVAEVLTP